MSEYEACTRKAAVVKLRRERAVPGGLGGCTSLSGGLMGKVTLEYRLEGSEGVNHDIWGKSIWAGKNSQCKGP